MPPRKFKPGQSGNPGGRPKLPPDVLAIQRLTPVRVARIINQFLEMPVNSVEECINKPDVPAIEKIIGNMVVNSTKGALGSGTLEFLLQRMIGKVKDVVEYSKDNKKIPELPQATSMISSALRLANAELCRLENKIAEGDSLSPDEAKAIPQLAKAVTDLAMEEKRIKDSLNLNQLSDTELETQVRQLMVLPDEATKQ